MKKLIICLMALVFATPLLAQNKGDMYIGGTMGVASSTSIINGSGTTGFGINVSPEFGYFISDKISIGASIECQLETANSSATTVIGILPTMTYYGRIADNFYYTPTLRVGFVGGFSSDLNMPGFGLNLDLASFEFRPTPKIGLSFSAFSLTYVVLTHNDSYIKLTNNNFNIQLGGTTSIGFKYYF